MIQSMVSTLPAIPQCSEALQTALHAVAQEGWSADVFRQNKAGCVPYEFPHRVVLERHGIIDSAGTVRFRLNTVADRLFLTDGPWNLRDGGVFPWADESRELLHYVDTHAGWLTTDAIVDMAAGCGHTVIGRAGSSRRVALDVSDRALCFVRFNAALNGLEVELCLGDVNKDLPVPITDDESILYVGNFPHVITPVGARLPTCVSGGKNGSDVTAAALATFGRKKIKRASIVLFTYSLYDSSTGRLQVARTAEELFGAQLKTTWVPLPQVRLWRVNGEKREPNPMPLLPGLERKAECRLSVPSEAEARVAHEYRELAGQLVSEGWDSVAAGLLVIDTPRLIRSAV